MKTLEWKEISAFQSEAEFDLNGKEYLVVVYDETGSQTKHSQDMHSWFVYENGKEIKKGQTRLKIKAKRYAGEFINKLK